MPTYIVKAAPDRDLYLEWSTIVDNATSVGTRAEYLASGTDPKRLDRADANGTSALPDPHMPAEYYTRHGLPGDWSRGALWVMNTRIVSDPCWLPRAHLTAYAEHLYADRVAEAEALLTPVRIED